MDYIYYIYSKSTYILRFWVGLGFIFTIHKTTARTNLIMTGDGGRQSQGSAGTKIQAIQAIQATWLPSQLQEKCKSNQLHLSRQLKRKSWFLWFFAVIKCKYAGASPVLGSTVQQQGTDLVFFNFVSDAKLGTSPEIDRNREKTILCNNVIRMYQIVSPTFLKFKISFSWLPQSYKITAVSDDLNLISLPRSPMVLMKRELSVSW